MHAYSFCYYANIDKDSYIEVCSNKHYKSHTVIQLEYQEARPFSSSSFFLIILDSEVKYIKNKNHLSVHTGKVFSL